MGRTSAGHSQRADRTAIVSPPQKGRCGSTNPILMYRGWCRRLFRRLCSLYRCCASNAFNRPSSSVSGQTSSALHHGCLRLRGHTNQRLRSHALYEGIQQPHREDRHRWGLVFYTYATPSRFHEHAPVGAQLHYIGATTARFRRTCERPYSPPSPQLATLAIRARPRVLRAQCPHTRI